MTSPSLARARKAILVVVGLLVSALFLWLTLRSVELGELWAHMTRASLPVLSTALVAKLTGLLFVTLRSRVVFEPVGAFGFGALFRSTFIVNGGNTILPLRLGELMRVNFLARTSGAPASSCLFAVGLERLLDLFCLMLLFAAITPLTILDLPAETSLWVLAGALTVGMAVALVVSRRPDWVIDRAYRLGSLAGPAAGDVARTLTGNLARGLASLRTLRGVVLVLLFTLGFWGAMVVEAWTWIVAFGLDLPWFTPFLILFFSALGAFLPSSPGAVGTYHFFTTQALLLVSVERTLATSVVFVGHALTFLPVALISLPWLVMEVVSIASARRVSSSPPKAGDTAPG